MFDWSFEDYSQVTGDTYWGVVTGPDDEAGINGGLLRRPVPAPAVGQGTNGYVCKVGVHDYDATEKRILQAGGQVALLLRRPAIVDHRAPARLTSAARVIWSLRAVLDRLMKVGPRCMSRTRAPRAGRIRLPALCSMIRRRHGWQDCRRRVAPTRSACRPSWGLTSSCGTPSYALWVPRILHRLCDLRVFVEQAAEAITTDDRGRRVHWHRRERPQWCRLLQGAVRPVGVEVAFILAQDGSGVGDVDDQDPIEQLAAGTAHESLADGIGSGARTGISTTSAPAPAKTASNASVYLVSRSRMRNLIRRPVSSRSISRLRGPVESPRPRSGAP